MTDKKSENFNRIAEYRTNKIIEMISKLSNLSNKSYYEYTQEQIDKMFSSIQDALDKQKSSFKSSDGKTKRFEL